MSGKKLEKGNTTTQSITKNTQHIAAQGNVIRNNCGYCDPVHHCH